MPAPPQQNARLTQVTGPGRQRQYGESGTAGPVKWAGSAGAYYRETLVQTPGPNDQPLNRVSQATLFVSDHLGPTLSLEPGDIITFTVRMRKGPGITQTRQVQDATTHPRVPGARQSYIKIGLVNTTVA